MEVFSLMCTIASLFKAKLIVMVDSFKKWTAKEKHTVINHVRRKTEEERAKELISLPLKINRKHFTWVPSLIKTVCS